ncbi:helix-turn-helix transcriptional regulator [Clostridium bowmanii]|uniref:helix-turn-helix transcriptional regulator n=1 Tax=Clostridium bowmanii TaxID=132925 RepID=UPI001C0CF235|nr:helix-turn-helix transcriptional regulator [Clostridium bowmanii]MBU3191360.1 helix-turn-helix transcriptional regulator [Clostridium bowmanii]MCA1073473.1 helix-turn-helix transcriptional regulator [Clostridium bowmanii]
MKNKINFYRKQKGITQEQLAENLSVTRQTINAIENDKYNPTLELAMKLGKFLGVPVEELFILDK